MTTFDEALPRLLRVCESAPGFASDVKKACVIRDLEGRLRLALELEGGNVGTALDVAALSNALSTEVGKYFAGPVLHSRDGAEVRRVVSELHKQSETWPEGWPNELEDSFTGQRTPFDTSRWCAVNRLLSKEAWISRRGTAKPPWPLKSGRGAPPAIVSFYSFKGGVGRTTLLALVTHVLAKRGKKIAVVDLDLEAPGVASFLGVNAATNRGVIDFLVDHVVTQSLSIEGMYAPAAGLPEGMRDNVSVFGAGVMPRGYLEKLARLDFAASRPERDPSSPSETGLRSLLTAIQRDLAPDYIFLDARAGLHDLGGLSLHNLSHVDVLVGRSGPQSHEGLRITLRTLARRRAPEDRRIVLVHSLVPPDHDVGAKVREDFQMAAYDLFMSEMYDDPENASSLEDDSAAHTAWPIPRYTELETARSIGDVDDVVKDGTPVRNVVERIEAMARPEEGAE
jgi:MinD-like ATPase involved in chromosome partitioning or flagellar assembly